MTIESCIAALAASPKGSRNLDADVYEALGFPVKREPKFAGRHLVDKAWSFLEGSRWKAMLHFSTSIEDALTLVPAESYWLLGKGRTRATEPLYAMQILDGDRVIGEAEHESGPMAICIAAMYVHQKVRSTTNQHTAPHPSRPSGDDMMARAPVPPTMLADITDLMFCYRNTPITASMTAHIENQLEDKLGFPVSVAPCGSEGILLRVHYCVEASTGTWRFIPFGNGWIHAGGAGWDDIGTAAPSA